MSSPSPPGKFTTWEGGHRVPGVVWWPGKVEAGRVEDAPLSHLDLLPTFLGLAGIALPTDRAFDGHDVSRILFPLLSRPAPPSTSHGDRVLLHMGDSAAPGGAQIDAVRIGPLKAVFLRLIPAFDRPRFGPPTLLFGFSSSPFAFLFVPCLSLPSISNEVHGPVQQPYRPQTVAPHRPDPLIRTLFSQVYFRSCAAAACAEAYYTCAHSFNGTLVFDLSKHPDEAEALPRKSLRAVAAVAAASRARDAFSRSISSGFYSGTNFTEGDPPTAWPCCNPGALSCRCNDSGVGFAS